MANKNINTEKIAKIGDTIKWTMPDNCGILSGKVFESEVAMVDSEEQHYGVYAEYGQDLIPFDSAVIIEPNHRIKCGEKMDTMKKRTFREEISEIRWWMFPILVIIALPCTIIDNYSNSKWFCNFWGWHKAPKSQGFNGCSYNGCCPRCGKSVLQDSQGNWF
jgi:hypothetical protein